MEPRRRDTGGNALSSHGAVTGRALVVGPYVRERGGAARGTDLHERSPVARLEEATRQTTFAPGAGPRQ